ncbi:MAG: efflux RND transporter periplasmic adaptor subunit [Hyphomicrobiaceae bacterium]
MLEVHIRLLRAGAMALAAFGLLAPFHAVEVAAQEAKPAASFTVVSREIDDLKAVIATVQAKDRIDARVRIAGTVAELKVAIGDHVKAGQVLATIADQKLALRIRAIDAQIVAAVSRMTTAKRELERAEELKKRGVVAQARIDQLTNNFVVARNDHKAALAERAVVQRQLEEGQVLAPAAGRVLKVPVTEGSVVLPGEQIAAIAANQYMLRLELAERHARFIRKGDPVRIGGRGLGPDQKPVGGGRIVKVYPELQGGRVVADAEVERIGDFFVGERVLAWVSAGKRQAIVVPAAFTFQRFGLDFVRLQTKGGQPIDVVVQLGRNGALAPSAGEVEVLAGLKPGDVLVAPPAEEALR